MTWQLLPTRMLRLPGFAFEHVRYFRLGRTWCQLRSMVAAPGDWVKQEFLIPTAALLNTKPTLCLLFSGLVNRVFRLTKFPNCRVFRSVFPIC